MKIIILLLLFISNLSAIQRYELICKKTLLDESYRVLISQIGIVEKSNRNDGEVEKYLKSVELNSGNPYCAAGQYWCFKESVINLHYYQTDIPLPKTGLANSIFNFAELHGFKSRCDPQIHDLIIWRKPGTSFGHTERIIRIGRAGWVETVGFNVECRIGKHNIQGVFKKKRNILYTMGRLVIRGLVGFRGIK